MKKRSSCAGLTRASMQRVGSMDCRVKPGNDDERVARGVSAIHRRTFFTLLGGAAAAWPLGAHAQQPRKMRRVGVLMNQAADDSEGQNRATAFVQELGQLGWNVGRNVAIDYRWGAGDSDRIRQYAAELVALAPDAILATGGTGVAPLLRVTREVPIVFVAVTDPVGAGYVESLARPGGNATGFILTEYGPQRQMVGASQADRAERETHRSAAGYHSGSR
jgi:hypothetical protein